MEAATQVTASPSRSFRSAARLHANLLSVHRSATARPSVCCCPSVATDLLLSATVGQLLSLKHLAVRGMSRVKSLGSEFYENDSPIHFPCLETLYFEDMQKWEDWIPLRSGQGDEGFPKLRELHIISYLNSTQPDPTRFEYKSDQIGSGCKFGFHSD